MITNEDKRKCAERELALRRAAYPKFVARGRMKQPVADREIALMQAIADDYSRPPADDSKPPPNDQQP